MVTINHIQFPSIAFHERSGGEEQLHCYITAYDKKTAKRFVKEFEALGIKIHLMLRCPRRKPELGVFAPSRDFVYLLFLTPHPVVHELHRKWYENAKIIYRRKE